MTVMSTLKLTKRKLEELEAAQARVISRPPPIGFYEMKTNRRVNSDGESDDRKDDFRTFHVPLRPGNANDDDTYEDKIRKFEDGTPFDFCTMRHEVEALGRNMGYYTPVAGETAVERANREANSLSPLYRAVITGQARRRFDSLMNTTHAHRTAHAKLTHTLNDMAKVIFENPDTAYSDQKKFLKSGLKIGHKNTPQEFAQRLLLHNRILKFYPRNLLNNGQLARNVPMPTDEVLEQLEQSRDVELAQLMNENKDLITDYQALPDDDEEKVQKYINALSSWHQVLEAKRKLAQRNAEERKQKNNKRGRGNDGHDNNSDRPKKKSRNNHNQKKGSKERSRGKNAECPHCKKMHKGRCWSLPENAGDRPDWYQPNKKSSFDKKVQKQAAKQAIFLYKEMKSKKAKRKREKQQRNEKKYDSDSEEDAYVQRTAKTLKNHEPSARYDFTNDSDASSVSSASSESY